MRFTQLGTDKAEELRDKQLEASSSGPCAALGALCRLLSTRSTRFDPEFVAVSDCADEKSSHRRPFSSFDRTRTAFAFVSHRGDRPSSKLDLRMIEQALRRTRSVTPIPEGFEVAVYVEYCCIDQLGPVGEVEKLGRLIAHCGLTFLGLLGLQEGVGALLYMPEGNMPAAAAAPAAAVVAPAAATAALAATPETSPTWRPVSASSWPHASPRPATRVSFGDPLPVIVT